jgi:ParB family chromosome partitioning protein
METVPIEKIDFDDRRFCVSYPLDDDPLFASVEKFGILLPVCLLVASRPVVVCGFRRLRAAQRLGIRDVPAVFLGLDEKKALLTAIHDNIARPLNTVEKALCVDRMIETGFSKGEVSQVMTVLGLPAREDVRATAIGLARAPEEIKAFVAGRRLPITSAGRLFWFEPAERLPIIRLLDRGRASVGMCRELLHLMMLVKVREGAIDFGALEGEADAAALRLRLAAMVSPILSGLRRELARILAACALPPAIDVKVDQDFERDYIDVSMRLRDEGELEEALQKLGGLRARGLFRSMFELTHGLSAGN